MSESSSSYRWWEFYFVRYATGTIVGGMVFFFLCATNSTLKALLLGATFQHVDAGLLPLFAVYGLAYCYLASAPILVLHACRFQIKLRPEKRSRIAKRIALVFIPPIVTAWFLHRYFDSSSVIWLLAVSLGLLIWWAQALLAYSAFANIDALLDFYRHLAFARQREQAGGGLVESYRHLREHGNSFSIVLFELVLGLVIFTLLGSEPVSGMRLKDEQAVSTLAFVVLIWVIPAASTWLLGTVMERKISGWS